MGYYVEVNTLVRLTDEVDLKSLQVGQKITLTRERERITPLHIALLYIDKDWNFYGYCRVNKVEISENKTIMVVEILSLFDETEKAIYKKRFVEAAKITSEIK
ncbi:MAG: hypothetical protein U0525_06085 [Patescibacteria group bacterium]